MLSFVQINISADFNNKDFFLSGYVLLVIPACVLIGFYLQQMFNFDYKH